MNHCSDAMQFHLDGAKVAIRYTPKFREYGIPILDGGSSVQMIEFCPWCRTKLPPSLRDEWFNRLEALGIDPYDDASMPASYRSDLWWQSETMK